MFLALGFRRETPGPFVAEVRRIGSSGAISSEQDTKHGRKYTVPGVLRGPAGSLEVITVWIRDTGREQVRLVTVRPKD